MTEFSEDESKILKPFFSNLDKDVFVLVNLPEVVKGALFSRYSRSSKSIRKLLLDEFINDEKMGFKEIVAYSESRGDDQVIATQKAEEFYDRVLVGYGDDSVAELGGAHIACENVSNIASKILEDSRIGLSPLEKSTRYVYYNKKVDDKYRYFLEDEIKESKHADLYIETCDSLFDTYTKLLEPTKKVLCEKFPQGDASDRAYRTSIKAKSCDILRGLLPAATTTNVGLFGNGRSFEYLITKMYSSELKEARDLATTMHEELMKNIPSFVKRASGKYGDPTIEFLSETRKDMQTLADKTFKGMEPENKESVVLTNYDKEAEEKVIAASLYPFTDLTFEQIKEKVVKMSEEERLNVVKTYQEKRQNRRHKPNRGFEHAYYEFDLICNYASYRDLHRHRMLTQQRQDLGVKNGYDVPPQASEIGFEKEFKEQMEIAADTYKTIYPDFRRQSQYVVPFAYRIRWNNYLNLRELYHLVELRSTIHGHPDYRRIVIKMHDEVKKVQPALVEYMKYIDYREVGLERLESEKKTDKKIKEVEQKYGAQ